MYKIHFVMHDIKGYPYSLHGTILSILILLPRAYVFQFIRSKILTFELEQTLGTNVP